MTDRNTIIRECIAVVDECYAPPLANEWGGGFNAAKTGIRFRIAHLLSVPDQAEASEPSQRASSSLAPVDRGPTADGEGEAGASQCTTCGERYPTAPPGYIHKCGKCRGMCRPITIAKPDDWTPDERTVRACIAAIDDGKFPAYIYKGEIDAKLKTLLPKPDPIAALVDEILGDYKTPSPEYYDSLTESVRRLVSEGRLRL